MKIEILYDSGAYTIFDTYNFCASNPFDKELKSAANITTEFCLKTDDISQGLVLEMYWYNAHVDKDSAYIIKCAQDKSARCVFCAIREPGRVVRLCTKEELEHVIWIKKDEAYVYIRTEEVLIHAGLAEAALLEKTQKEEVVRAASVLRETHIISDKEIAERLKLSSRSLRKISEHVWAQMQRAEKQS